MPNRSHLAPLALLPLLMAAAAGAAAPGPTPEVAAAAARIDRATLAAATRFLASDLLEGRGPGSRGDELARAYLASELEAAGLAPGGPDGSWQQRFEMVGLRTRAPGPGPSPAPAAAPTSPGGTIGSAPRASRRRSPSCATPSWCSPATASRRPSSSGTTSRAPTSRARS